MTVYRSSGPRLAALAIVAATLVAQSPAPDPRLAAAGALLERGSVPEAVDLLESAVEARPGDAEAHLMLGTALARLPRRAAAVEALLRALELRPDHAPGYALAGMAFSRLGELDAALRVFQRAVELNPALGEVHLNLALILAGRGEFERAAERLAQALRLEREAAKRARLHFLTGKLHAERGRPEEAAGEFERSIELDARNGAAYLALGLARKRLLREDAAYPLFQRAVELAPDDPEARYQLALELQRRGSAQAAADQFLKAYARRPGDQAILYNLARALHRAGRAEEAQRYRKELAELIEAADKAREHELETARLHGEAVALDEAGAYAAALAKYRAVLEFEPLNAVARRNLALVLCRLDRWQEGIDELRAILRDDPDDAESARALAIALDQARGARDGPELGRGQDASGPDGPADPAAPPGDR